MGELLIGEVAKRADVSAATVRYYEEVGLLTPAPRSSAGYRRYTEGTVEELRFVRKAQALGFSLDEIGEILKLSRAGRTPCSHVLDLAKRHVAGVDERIRQLTRFRAHLAGEIAKWDGERQPTCQGLCQIIAGASDEATDGAPMTSHIQQRRSARSTRQ
ncbi:MAG: heavy metal-responsive transcriptional regulator [Acidobacteria bacterium]|nr:heavy metal-responsive transcriptional regulator [Acidobacteriota bacterium]